MKGASRIALHRIGRILGVLRSGEFASCSALARMLGVSHKTIRRDLQFLRRRGADLQYRPEMHCWFCALPAPDLMVQEGPSFDPVAVRNLVTIARRILNEPRFYYAWTGDLEKQLEPFQHLTENQIQHPNQNETHH